MSQHPVPGRGYCIYCESASDGGSQLGYGHRYVVVAEVGRRWITVIDPATLKLVKLTHLPKAQEVSGKTSRYAKRIRDKIKLYQKLGKHIPKNVLAAYKRLRTMKES